MTGGRIVVNLQTLLAAIHADLPTEEFFSGRLQGRASQFLKGEMGWSVE